MICAAVGKAQFPESAVRRGNRYLHQQKYAEAQDAYGRALRRDTAYFPAVYNMGHAAYGDSSWLEALSWWRRALQQAQDTPTRAHIYYNMGNALIQAGRVEESIKAYINALKLNPHDDSARYNLSYALHLLRKNQQQNQPQQNHNHQQNHQNNQQQQSKQPSQSPPQPSPLLAQKQVEQLLQIASEEERKAAERLLRQHQKTPVRPTPPW